MIVFYLPGTNRGTQKCSTGTRSILQIVRPKKSMRPNLLSIISPCIGRNQVAHIRQLLGYMIATKTWKYMGVPISGSKLHKGDFQDIISDMEGRIGLYSSSFSFSWVGGCFFKLVSSIPPIHLLGHWKVPVGVLNMVHSRGLGRQLGEHWDGSVSATQIGFRWYAQNAT